MHVCDPARIPPRDNGHKLTLSIVVRELIASAVGKSFLCAVARIASVAVAMPNIDTNIGHGLTILVAENPDPLPQTNPRLVFSDVLTKEKIVLVQVEWKRACSF
jgi:hypothetical protein